MPSRPIVRRLAWAASVALLPLPTVVWAQGPVYFRHDAGRAAVDEQPLPSDLDDAHQVWKQPLPPGHSTPMVFGERIFLTGHEDGRLSTICLERGSGKPLWMQTVTVESVEKVHQEGSPAAASVACDGQRVVAFFGSVGLVCYNLDGKLLWTRKLGPFRDEFGAASSPILVDGQVILNEDHDLDSFLLAVRGEDGRTLWQTSRDGFTRSYATPVVWEAGGTRLLVVAGALQLVAYDLASGRQRWSLDGFARIVNSTPTKAGDMLYVCSWSPGGDSEARIAMEPWSTALQHWDKNQNARLENEELPAGEVRARFFRIDLNSDQALDEVEWNKYARIFELAENTLVALQAAPGGAAPRIVWRYKRGLPYVASPLFYRGHVYLVKDGGIVTVLDAATGKLLRQSRARGEGHFYASPAAGDGKVIIASGGGVVTLLKAGPQSGVLFSRDFGERIAATPVLADGHIYIRTEKALYAFAPH
jgi:outer membrane protein assembly factor BamB